MDELGYGGLPATEAKESGKRLFDDFSEIAESGRDETEVEFAITAQAEVV